MATGATSEIPRSRSAGNLQEGGEYQAFAVEEVEDSRRLRQAIVGAVCLHLVLFLLNFGFLKPAVATASPPQHQVIAIVPVRFKPPLPKTQRQMQEPVVVKVPIPDPTPDDPEPIRIAEEIRQELAAPDVGIVDIPDAPPPLESPRPLPVGGDVSRPLRIFGPDPQYTEVARKARIQGVVIVEAIIDKSGNVNSVRVLKALPMGLDQAAVDAIRKWKFEPATLNGKPVDVYYNLTVNFRLQ